MFGVRFSVALIVIAGLSAGCGEVDFGEVSQGLSAKKLTNAEGVDVGPGDIIDTEYIAVRKKFYNKGDEFALHLTLTELRVSGQGVFLGEQTLPVADTTLLTLDGPDGRPVVEVTWATDTIEAGSDIEACVEVVKIKNGKIASENDCRTLVPQLP